MGRIHHMVALCFGRVGRSSSQIFCPARFLFMGIPVHLIRSEDGAEQRVSFLVTNLVASFPN